MADSEEPQLLKDLANLAREKGEMMEPENDNDTSDRWSYSLDQWVCFVFHAQDEYTNRIYKATKEKPYVAAGLDVRENTFDGMRYPKGSRDDLKALHVQLKTEIDSLNAAIAVEDKAREGEGFSIKDGMGAHKL